MHQEKQDFLKPVFLDVVEEKGKVLEVFFGGTVKINLIIGSQNDCLFHLFSYF